MTGDIQALREQFAKDWKNAKFGCGGGLAYAEFRKLEPGFRDRILAIASEAYRLGASYDAIAPLLSLIRPAGGKLSVTLNSRIQLLDWMLMKNEPTPDSDTIELSRPMSKKNMAVLLGYKGSKKAEWINQCVKDGTLRIHKGTRQSWRLDMSCVPENLRDKFRAKSPEAVPLRQ